MNRSVLAAPLVVAAVAGAFLFGGGSTPKVAVAADPPAATSGVLVDGLGKTTGTPDVLRVVLGVTLRRPDVSAALADANARQTRLRDALKRAGVAPADLQTSDVSVYPSYDNKGRPDGYQVSETLTAKLRNLTRAGRVISGAVGAGGSEATVQGVSFALEDNADLLKQARDNAYTDAKDKAQRYAQLSGRTLGDVQLIAESAQAPQQLPQALDSFRAVAGQAGKVADVPVDPGSSQVSVSVTVRWALR